MKILRNFAHITSEVNTAPKWLAGVFSQLTAWAQNVNQALIQNITIGDNIPGIITTVQVKTSSVYNKGSFSRLVVPWTFSAVKTPQTVLVGQITWPSNQEPLLNSVGITNWTYDSTTNAININYISGLVNNSTYTITLEIK